MLSFCWLKNKSQPESKECLIQWECLELQTWEAVSQVALRNYSEGRSHRIWTFITKGDRQFQQKRLLLMSGGGSDGKESACKAGDPGSSPRSGRSPEEGHGNPLFLPGESHGQRILAGYSPWGRKESNRKEGLTLTKENQRAQVKEFSALLCICMELRKSLDYWSHSCHMHLSYLQPASWFFLVCFFFYFSHPFPIPPSPPPSNPWGGERGAWCQYLLDPRYYFPFGEPSFTLGDPKSLMAVTSLFIEKAEDIPFHI